MKEAIGNLWEANTKFIRCVTTNGIVKRNGELVMGRGNALQATQRYPQLSRILGSYVETSGNMVYYLEQFNVASFPVKHNWRDKADIELIKKSCHQLNALLNNLGRFAVLPRPGCSNGRLYWERDVKPVISQILSDRVWVINQPTYFYINIELNRATCVNRIGSKPN